MEAIVNADFGSKKTSNGSNYENGQWTQVIVGQNQNSDGTIANDTPFYGRISKLISLITILQIGSTEVRNIPNLTSLNGHNLVLLRDLETFIL